MPYDDYHDHRLADIDYGRPHYFDGPDYYDPPPNNEHDLNVAIDNYINNYTGATNDHLRTLVDHIYNTAYNVLNNPTPTVVDGYDDAACGIDHNHVIVFDFDKRVVYDDATHVVVRRDDYDRLIDAVDKYKYDRGYLHDAARHLIDHTDDDGLADGIHRHLNP